MDCGNMNDDYVIGNEGCYQNNLAVMKEGLK